MSIFGTIMSKIFHHAEAAPSSAGTPPATPSAPQPGTADAPSASTTPGSATQTASAAPAPGGTATSTVGSAAAGGQSVDVAAVLDGLAAKNSQTLDWKHSIVDMLKLLDMDSSLQARKELAKELNYTGNTDDSASMNMWLHGQVMKKLAENGGQVPADLRH